MIREILPAGEVVRRLGEEARATLSRTRESRVP